MAALALLCPLALLCLAACGSPVDVAPADSAHPTIVSLNPCSDAVLAQIAGPRQLLAISAWSHDPAASSMEMADARRFRSVSGSVEEVLALRPDLVVAGTFMPPSTRAALADQHIRVVQIGIATSVAESRDQVSQLARIAGRAAQGRALNARIDAALARAAPPAGTAPVSAVVWQSGGIVPGQGTLIADLLRRTGFTLFSAERGLKQADFLPLEEMLANPPQVILVASNQRSNEDRLLGHPALTALKNTRRERLDPALLWCGGPTIIRAAQRMGEVRRTIGA